VHGLVVPDAVAHIVVITRRTAHPPLAPIGQVLPPRCRCASPGPLVVAVGIILADVGQDRILHIAAVQVEVPSAALMRAAKVGVGSTGVQGVVPAWTSRYICPSSAKPRRLHHEKAVLQVLLFGRAVQEAVIAAGLGLEGRCGRRDTWG